MAGNFGDTVPDDEFTLDEIAEMRRKCREFRAAVLDGIAGCEANLDRLEREITMAPLPIRVAA
jgi:predicted DNA-binding protein YlxM (UPF0122 family)